jgi:hypothetical protein
VYEHFLAEPQRKRVTELMGEPIEKSVLQSYSLFVNQKDKYGVPLTLKLD